MRRGAADYMAMEGEFAKYLEDVYSDAPIEREALDDECEVLVVGGGFGGLILLVQTAESRIYRCPVLREGRRCRRDLVLEPISWDRLRRRII